MADRPRVSDLGIDGSNGRLCMQAHGVHHVAASASSSTTSSYLS